MTEQRDEAYELVVAQQQTEIESLRAQLAEVTALKDRLLQTVATHAEEVGGYYSQILATQTHAARMEEALEEIKERGKAETWRGETREGKIAREALSAPINLDALHEERARKCERLKEFDLELPYEFTKSVDEFLEEQAAAHRAKKEGK